MPSHHVSATESLHMSRLLRLSCAVAHPAHQGTEGDPTPVTRLLVVGPRNRPGHCKYILCLVSINVLTTT